MLKKSFMLLMFTGLILVGCTDDQSEKKINDSEMVEPLEPQENDSERIIIPELQLNISNDSVRAIESSSCWNEEDCSLKFVHPKEREYRNNYMVKPGQMISLYFVGTQNHPNIIYPDTIEVTQYHDDEEEKFEVPNMQIKAPSEKGIYYYQIHAKWTEKIEGEIYYAAKVRVR